MPPKRSAAKLKQVAPPSDDSSDSSSGFSSSSYRRLRQNSRGIKNAEQKFESLHLEALLSLVVGVATRLSVAVSALKYSNVTGNGRIIRETMRLVNGALDPLTDSIDELSALEGALLQHLLRIEGVRVSCARRATVRPQTQ